MTKAVRFMTLLLVIALGACDALVESIRTSPTEWALSSSTDTLTGNSTPTAVRTVSLDEGVVEITAICHRDINLMSPLPDTDDPAALASAFFNDIVGNVQNGILGQGRSDALAFTVTVHPHKEQASLLLDDSNTDGQNMLVRASFREGEAVRLVSEITHVNSLDLAIGVQDIRSANRPLVVEVPLLYRPPFSNNQTPSAVSGVIDFASNDPVFRDFLEDCSPSPEPPRSTPQSSSAAVPTNALPTSTPPYSDTAGQQHPNPEGPNESRAISDRWSPTLEQQLSQQYRSCIDNSGGSSLGMIPCTQDEIEAWDARLNDVWRRLPESTRSELLSEQREWIRLKERECGELYDEGGTAGRVNSLGCVLARTIERTMQLEERDRFRF